MRDRREELACGYLNAFEGLPVQLPPRSPAGDTHAWHLFILRITSEAPVDRDGFIGAMTEHGIGTSVHFIPLHMHTIWHSSLGLEPPQFPHATEQFDRVVSLPLYSSMTHEQMQRVIGAVTRILT
jgi:dTDP-4-amino-4,6-dideoxygalactose transaminase